MVQIMLGEQRVWDIVWENLSCPRENRFKKLI